jgi:hypothetical protein
MKIREAGKLTETQKVAGADKVPNIVQAPKTSVLPAKDGGGSDDGGERREEQQAVEAVSVSVSHVVRDRKERQSGPIRRRHTGQSR